MVTNIAVLFEGAQSAVQPTVIKKDSCQLSIALYTDKPCTYHYSCPEMGQLYTLLVLLCADTESAS